MVRDLGIIRLRVGQLVRQFEGEILTAADQVERFAIGEQKRVFGLPIRPNVAPFKDQFIERNTQLIQSLSARQIEQVANIIDTASAVGSRVEDIAKDIEKTFNVTQSKAQLLARDQTLKLNSAITQATHRELGVTQYIWSTSQDERVRESHEALEGQVFSWDSPPSVGHPGEDYQCRCIAFPIIPDLDPDLIAGFL